jgi:hypothetical protein
MSQILKVPHRYDALAMTRTSRAPTRGYMVDSVLIRVKDVPSSDVAAIGTATLPGVYEASIEAGGIKLDFRHGEKLPVEMPYVAIEGRLYRPLSFVLDGANYLTSIMYRDGNPAVREALEDWVRCGFLRVEGAAVLFEHQPDAFTKKCAVPFIDHDVPSMWAYDSMRVGVTPLSDMQAYPKRISDRQLVFAAQARRLAAGYRSIDGVLYVPTTGPSYAVTRADKDFDASAIKVEADVVGSAFMRADVPVEIAMEIYNEDLPAPQRLVRVAPSPWSVDIGAIPGSPALATVREVGRGVLAEWRNWKPHPTYANVLPEFGLEAVGNLAALLEARNEDVTAHEGALETLDHAFEEGIELVPYLASEWSQTERWDLVNTMGRLRSSVRLGSRLIAYERSLTRDCEDVKPRP